MTEAEKPASRLLRYLSENTRYLIGKGGKFESVAEVGARPHGDPIGTKAVYRVMNAEREPTLLQLERLSQALAVPAPLLLCKDMQPTVVFSATKVRPEVEKLIGHILALDQFAPLTADHIDAFEGLLRVITGAPSRQAPPAAD
ncbi:hypothetical protein [Burkholderia gladioli]|uniref:hypothetical protein n=1 Tax=Burkholderia gladioli TaxID=28095 RepID=UPI00163FC1DC|nr:hypothetical protein [Burkholderia gladioli]